MMQAGCCCAVLSGCDVCDLRWRCDCNCQREKIVPIQPGSRITVALDITTSRSWPILSGGTCSCAVSISTPSIELTLVCDADGGAWWISSSTVSIDMPIADPSSAGCSTSTCCDTVAMDCTVAIAANCWLNTVTEVAIIPTSDYEADIAISQACVEYYQSLLLQGVTQNAYRFSADLSGFAASAPSCLYQWQLSGSADISGSTTFDQNADTSGTITYGPIIPAYNWTPAALGLTSSSTAEQRLAVAYKYTDWCSTGTYWIRYQWFNDSLSREGECFCPETLVGACDGRVTRYEQILSLNGNPGVACGCGLQEFGLGGGLESCGTITLTASGASATRTWSCVRVVDYLIPGFATSTTHTTGSAYMQYTAGSPAVLYFSGASASKIHNESYQCLPCYPIEPPCDCSPIYDESCTETTESFTLIGSAQITWVRCT